MGNTHQKLLVGPPGAVGPVGPKGESRFPATWSISHSGIKLNVDGAAANDMWRFGETTQVDVQVDGSAGDLLWDASASTLSLSTGNAMFAYSAGNSLSELNVITSATGPLAASLSTPFNQYSGGTVTGITLAAGTYPGQTKSFTVCSGTADHTITFTGQTNPLTATLSGIGDSVTVMWNGSKWVPIWVTAGTSAGVVFAN